MEKAENVELLKQTASPYPLRQTSKKQSEQPQKRAKTRKKDRHALLRMDPVLAHSRDWEPRIESLEKCERARDGQVSRAAMQNMNTNAEENSVGERSAAEHDATVRKQQTRRSLRRARQRAKRKKARIQQQ